jgi:hypothetical protein
MHKPYMVWIASDIIEAVKEVIILLDKHGCSEASVVHVI